MALCRVIVMWLVWVIVLFLIEFNSILEIYNNPTPQIVGFFIEVFLKITTKPCYIQIQLR
jgi:hypothetical protein